MIIEQIHVFSFYLCRCNILFRHVRWLGCQQPGSHSMYVLSGQMGMSQKPSGTVGNLGTQAVPSYYMAQASGDHGSTRQSGICANVVLLAGHRVLHCSCLNFNTSELLCKPPIRQLSQVGLPFVPHVPDCHLIQCDGTIPWAMFPAIYYILMAGIL